MNKLIKKILLVLIILIAYFIIKPSISMAFGFGNLSSSDNHWYCVAYGQYLNSGHTFKLKKTLKINKDLKLDEAKKLNSGMGTGGYIFHDVYAKMAYILAAENYPKYYGSSDEYGGVRQKAVWSIWNEFMNAAGLSYTHDNNSTAPSTTESQQLISNAESYATNVGALISNGGPIVDNSTTAKMKITKIDGNNYLFVGPINWGFVDSIDSIVVKKDGSIISSSDIKYAKHSKSNGWTIFSNGKSDIRSGNNFYILLPATTQITSKITTEVKLSENFKIYKATIKIYEHIPPEGVTKAQRVIKVGTSSKTIPGEATFTYYKKTGNLMIEKVDENTEETIIEDVKFKLKRSGTDMYVNENSNGEICYKTTGKVYTTENGKKTIENLLPGVYEFYEVSIANPDYPNPTTPELKRDDLEVEIDGEASNEYWIFNEKYKGNLEIFKLDENTKKPLIGVEFRIKYHGFIVEADLESDGTYTLKGYNDRNTKKYSLAKDPNGTTFITDSNGEIKIKGLDVGTYDVYEIKSITDYPSASPTQKCKIGTTSSTNFDVHKESNSTDYSTYKIYNPKDKGRLRVYKKDKNTKIPLQGVKFKILNSDGLLVLANAKSGNAGGYTFVEYAKIESDGVHARKWNESANDWTGDRVNVADYYCITNSSGTIRIDDLDVDNYSVYEMNMGNNTGYPDISSSGTKCTIESTSTNNFEVIQKDNNGISEYTVYNPKDKGHLQIYKTDKNNTNIPLKGVTFKLTYQSGNDEYLVISTGSSTNGTYTFKEYAKLVSGTYRKWNPSSKTWSTALTSSDNYTFVTNSDGKIKINGLDVGTYYAYETSIGNNSNYQSPNSNNKCKIGTTSSSNLEVRKANNNNDYSTYDIYNPKKTGNLEVYKYDAYYKTERPLNKVSFKLKYIETIGSTTYTRYIRQEGNNLVYVGAEQLATPFETGKDGIDGQFKIDNLDIGTYELIELKNENGEYIKTDNKTVTITEAENSSGNFGSIIVSANQTSQYKEYNEQDTRDVTITGKVWAPNKFGKDEKDITDSTAGVYNGNYSLIEGIKVELYTTGEYQTITTDKGTIKRVKMTTTGKEDLVKEGNRATTSTEKVNSEKIITTNVVVDHNTTTTNENGEYSFTLKGIHYSELELPYYKVRFSYEGMDFQGCTPNYTDVDNGSKATENSGERTLLNEKFEIISGTEENLSETKDGKQYTYGYSRQHTNLRTGDLQYEVVGNKATVTNVSVGYDDKQNNKIKIKGTDLKNAITATYSMKKNEPNGNPGVDSYLTKKTNSSNGKIESETVRGINLGLIKRGMPDLSVENSIQSVVTTINGYNNLYKTGRSQNDPKNSDLKVGVTYVTSEAKLANFTVYPSDVKTWNMSEITNKLQVYITYKVKIINESDTLYNKINELAVYYDESYELLYIGDELDGTKFNYAASKSRYNFEQQSLNDDNSKYNKGYRINKYKKVCINLEDTTINPKTGNTKELYMTYKVNDEEIKKMLKDTSYVPTLKNVVEINAYSTYYDKECKNSYAGVDKDSAAGNINETIINNRNKESASIAKPEDDTGVASEFKIDDSQNLKRTLTGKVFLDEDKNHKNLNSNGERKGNSYYDNGEKGLAKVKVNMIGLEDSNYKSDNMVLKGYTGYDKMTTEKVDYTNITTNEDGDYTISGFIPGDYVLKYTYDNNTYYNDSSGQRKINAVDYKSAIIVDGSAYKGTNAKGAFENQAKENGAHNDTNWYKLDNPYIDIIGKETFFRRYSEALDDWSIRQKIDEKYKDVDINKTGEMAAKDSKSMTATTPNMEIAVELNTVSSGNTYTPPYKIVNMDFGITERPRQQLKLEKKVSGFKLILASGQVLIDTTLDDNGNIVGQATGIKAVPGVVDVELDNELIHGATIEIEYAIKVTNISELDYVDEKYYKYGIIPSNKDGTIVKIRPTIVDYVDNKLVYDKKLKQNEGWTEITSNDLQDKVDGNNILYTEEINENVKSIMKKNINVILQDECKNDLVPGKSEEFTLKLTKLISNTSEDMTYNNDVEVITAKKNGGRTIISRLGTYTRTNRSGIGDSSQELTITPPTGKELSNTTYYITAITGILSIIAGGILLLILRRKK